MFRIPRIVSLLLMACSFTVASSVVKAEIVNCTPITTVPFTISTPGVYCVKNKISSTLMTGAAITINANNVLLDLNDFAIGNIGAGPTTQAVGILSIDHQNITVRNGILRGFIVGVALVNGTTAGSATTTLSSGHRVENITTDTSYAAGIGVEGPFGVVQNNKVMNTLGSALPIFPGNPGSGNNAVGIHVVGDGALVRNNSVLQTDCSNSCITSSGQSVQGIQVHGSNGAVVEDNRVSNTSIPTAVSMLGWAANGITVGSSDGLQPSYNAVVQNNLVMNWQGGIVFNTNSTGVYTGNGVLGTPTSGVSYTGGTDPLLWNY